MIKLDGSGLVKLIMATICLLAAVSCTMVRDWKIDSMADEPSYYKDISYRYRTKTAVTRAICQTIQQSKFGDRYQCKGKYLRDSDRTTYWCDIVDAYVYKHGSPKYYTGKFVVVLSTKFLNPHLSQGNSIHFDNKEDAEKVHALIYKMMELCGKRSIQN
jgi:hypothetical protein